MSLIAKMIMKLLFAYQKFISPLLGNSCRYYPSCSEYAKWRFETEPVWRATIFTTARILRCNKLFDGGLDYPIVKFTPSKTTFLKEQPKLLNSAVKYWFVPKDAHGRFFVVKAL